MSKRTPKRSGSSRSGGFTGTPLTGTPRIVNPIEDTLPSSNPFKPTQSIPGPGQSVLPGSIQGQTPWNGYTWYNNPEWVGNSRNEGFNTLAWIQTLLSNMNNGGSYGQGFSDLINTILQQIATGGKDTALSPDMIQALFTNLLQYQSTAESREYDYKMLNESRLYNNPQNELARLMGAGISRDAAIQLLSGSAGGQGVGSAGAAAAAVQPPVAGAGAGVLNSSNAHANLVNNVFAGIQLIANLVGQGVSIAQAVESTQALSMQNYMTREQLAAYDSVNQVTKALENAIHTGIIEPSDMDSWSNADDVYKWLIDHSESNLVKPLQQSGAINGAFGSTIGREMFNHHWQQKRESQKGGDVFDQYLTQQILGNKLANLDIEKSYLDIDYAIGQISKQDAEIAKIWQDVSIGAVDLKIKGHEETILSFTENQQRTQNAVFNEVYNTDNSNRDITSWFTGNRTGAQMIAFDQYQELMHRAYKSYVNAPLRDPESWAKFYVDNKSAAFYAAGIDATMKHLQTLNLDPQSSPYASAIISMWNLLKQCGAIDAIEIAAPYTPFLFTPNKPQ